MARSDVIRADLERIQSMSDGEFAEKWGAWARSQDRDLDLVRQRWVEDLEYALPYAEAEEAACEDLVAAKDAYRDDPSEENKVLKAAAVEAVQLVRAEERLKRVDSTGRPLLRLGGDAYPSGG